MIAFNNNPELLQSLEGALRGEPRRWEWSSENNNNEESSYRTDYRGDDEKEGVEPTSFVQINGEITKTTTRQQQQRRPPTNDGSENALLSWLVEGGGAGVLLMPVLPLLWCVLFVSTMDREALLSAWGMPLLGIASASLANAVPVGGGIVFVPALKVLLGIDLRLGGAAFAVATMSFGNGVFGFLSWLKKDPSSIAWSVVPFALVPAWVGAACASFYPFLSPARCQQLFACFCLFVAAIVARNICVVRNNNNGQTTPGSANHFSIYHSPVDNDGGIVASSSFWKKLVASTCSFFAGLVLVAHTGIGNAITTFLVASLVWKLPPKACVVTGILVGGWTSVVPFVLHLVVFKDVPIAPWVMVLPGVYLGARIAPVVHDLVGLPNVLASFCVFLIATALLMLSSAAEAS